LALRNGIDTVAIATLGVYSETYASASNQANMNILYATWGFLETYIGVVAGIGGRGMRRLGLSLSLR
jgi:hypothetical protein